MEFLIDIILTAETVALGPTQDLTEMSTRNIMTPFCAVMTMGAYGCFVQNHRT